MTGKFFARKETVKATVFGLVLALAAFALMTSCKQTTSTHPDRTEPCPALHSLAANMITASAKKNATKITMDTNHSQICRTTKLQRLICQADTLELYKAI